MDLVVIHNGTVTAERYTLENMQDNVIPHVEQTVRNYLEEEQINTTAWLERSLHLKSIENHWGIIGR